MKVKKLWDKGINIDHRIEKFTIGRDRELDLEIAEWDVLGSMAHIQMLNEIGIITDDEHPVAKKGLKDILISIKAGKFKIEPGIEDVHSQVEILLTRQIGHLGGKIHTGRSRNDQVLLDLKLYYRAQIQILFEKITSLSELLLDQAEKFKHILMPGYTHTQVAMTSSFGLWFGGFAEAFSDDCEYLLSILPIINKNPLGSAAGYGSSFPLKRQTTTDLLGFETMHFNPINAQYNRGKAELIFAQSIAVIAIDINKLASDVILYSNENHRFLKLPDELTTGSSIMPHKKNPDVFEIIRANSNYLINLPGQISQVISNLVTGYHRDFQLLKEILLPAIDKVEQIIEILIYSIPQLKVSDNILADQKYDFITSVDAVNEKVIKGHTFRKAYKEIGEAIEKGEFNPPKKLDHTHEGSIGNLCLDRIRENIEKMKKRDSFKKINDSLSKLCDI